MNNASLLLIANTSRHRSCLGIHHVPGQESGTARCVPGSSERSLTIVHRKVNVERPKYSPPHPRVTSPRANFLAHALHATYVKAATCPMRPIICPACKNQVLASILEKHLEETCSERMVECEKGCGENIPVSGVRRHLDQVSNILPRVALSRYVLFACVAAQITKFLH